MVSSITQEEERLTEMLTKYYVHAEQNSQKVRKLNNKDELYEVAATKWKNDGPRIPPPDDEQKQAEFFDQCNEICSKEPEGPEECVTPLLC
jgi:hypothetical protein